MMSQRIHIGSQPGPKGGWTIAVTDADTKELLEGLSDITIKLEADNVVVADVSYVGGATQTRYIESINVVISGEAVDKP